MSQIFVRTTWASDLSHNARAALEELADYEQAVVSARPTSVVDGKLNINSKTAMVLVRQGYANSAGDTCIAINEDGLRKIGRITESRAERRRQAAAKSLDAQASGKWVPAPAGASATASQAEADARGDWVEANAEVRHAYEQLEWERESLKMSQRWGGFSEDELAECKALIAAAEARVSDAEAALAALRVP